MQINALERLFKYVEDSYPLFQPKHEYEEKKKKKKKKRRRRKKDHTPPAYFDNLSGLMTISQGEVKRRCMELWDVPLYRAV